MISPCCSTGRATRCPPEYPVSDDDPGVMGINYRCDSMPEQLKLKNDPAHIFSSFVYGDPVSPLAQAQTIGISEVFNLHIDEPYAAGDYLYYSGGIDDLWLGLWGIIRAHATPQKDLLPPCGIRPIAAPKAPPASAVVRKFEIAAIQKALVYNRFGDHDPEGLVFVPLEQARDVLRGCRKPVPLILRANAGDWIEVTLHNLFDPKVPIQFHDYPSVPVAFPHVPGDRVSLSPRFLKFDPVASSGVTWAMEQTVGPGECVEYLWHTDREYGACLPTSFGDLRNHRHHGLFGAVIVEPLKAKYYSGICPMDENYKEEAVITAPGTETFREFVLFAHNGIRLLDRDGNLIKTTEQGAEEGGHDAPDHGDTGEKSCNYRSEQFFNRLKRVPLIEKVFDSKVHGDPATPLFQTYAGERVIIRLLMPADKPRNISFALHGHRWRAQPEAPFTRGIPVQGAISVGNVFNVEPEPVKCPVDYLYRSGSPRWDVESGMWGLPRLLRRSIRYQCENACRNVRRWWERQRRET